MVQASDYKTATVVARVVAAVVLGALLLNTVMGEVQYQRQDDFGFHVGWVIMLSTYGPAGLAAMVGGFLFMRKAPMLCALSVSAGSLSLGILVFWLVIPVPLAIAISFYAVRRARGIQAGVSV